MNNTSFLLNHHKFQKSGATIVGGIDISGIGMNIGDKCYSTLKLNYSDGTKGLFLKEVPNYNGSIVGMSVTGLVIGGHPNHDDQDKWFSYNELSDEDKRSWELELQRREQKRFKREEKQKQKEQLRKQKEQLRKQKEQEQLQKQKEQEQSQKEQREKLQEEQREKLQEEKNVLNKVILPLSDISISPNMKEIYENFVTFYKTSEKSLLSYDSKMRENMRKLLDITLNTSIGVGVGCIIGNENEPSSGCIADVSMNAKPELEITFTNPNNSEYKATLSRDCIGCTHYKDFVYFKLPSQKLSHKEFCDTILNQLLYLWQCQKSNMPKNDVKITFLYWDIIWG
jgi:hypothetical protein